MQERSAAAKLATTLLDVISAELEKGDLAEVDVRNALAITAARSIGSLFDQGDPYQRDVHAKALGAHFASVADAIWTSEAQMWPDEGAAKH